MMCEEIEYQLYPQNTDCIFTTEYWKNSLRNGKEVIILHTQQWFNGTFSIELTPENKEKILSHENIIVNDWGGCVENMETGRLYELKIKNEEYYNEEEKKEIQKLMFCNKENDTYNSEAEYEFEQDIMEANNWILDDTIYEIKDGIELEQNT